MNTLAKLSCVVTFLTKELDEVKWENSGAVIVHGKDGYEIDEGTYDNETNTQTTVLTIPADKNTADSVYNCVIKSLKDHVANRFPVILDVFSKL